MSRLNVLLLSIVLCIPAVSMAAETEKPPQWSAVYRWAYQLQHPRTREIAASPFDLVVIDYSRDGCPSGRFRRDEVAQMQRRPDGGRRLVVAYMSIGEAEPYRFYWQEDWKPGHPSWLLEPNPRWPDNYRVEYWNPEWKALLFGSPTSYLDQIIEAGFDGVYLDIVDGYEAFRGERKTAKADMVALVREIAHYARKTKNKPHFGVFPQNASELVEQAKYLEVITGIGKEETYFFDTDDETEEDDRVWDEALLERVLKAGKLVLTVDYCHEPANIAQTIRRARKRGFIPYCTDVELDRLTIRDEATAYPRKR